ncbi:MAG: efflux RND transporter permease subunit [Paramuribaculum sp.]|nr:efflux RND transporter permease subunit [Paramuribaculum sp.]
MSIKTFIDRPVLSCVLSVFIVLLGAIGLSRLPMEQFPEIAPPTVRVSATYTGANAETLQRSVIAPLEEAINGVEGINYMTSSANNNGQATVTIYFRQGTDPDMAAVNVQNRIAQAQGLLPAEVVQSGVNVRKSQNSTAKIVALYSPDDRYDQKFIFNYFKINIEPRLARVPGVGDITLFGSDYSLRIWLKPEKMAVHGLIPTDIEEVLAEQNIEIPTGTLGADGENRFQYALKYRGRYETEDEFRQLVIRSTPDGGVLRLGDVADVELGQLSYSVKNELSGHPGTNCMIAQMPGSNANELVEKIDKVIKSAAEELPEGLELVDLMSVKSFMDASISNVLHTLIEAIVLVILVVMLFLQNLRSSLIPGIAIIVSLVGTLAFLYFAGFSLNMLTLFALVLVIGTVVDDAIVVVEAVQSQFDTGEKSPYQATVKGMAGISRPLITTSLVFMAVFVPVCFIEGAVGIFYRQFGLTMAVAVLISTFNAMTLSPALCVLIMKPADETGKFTKAFNAAFNAIGRKYQSSLSVLFQHKWIVIGFIILAIGSFAILLSITKTGLVPDEDTGTVVVDIQAAPGTSKARTEQIMAEVEGKISDIPQFQIYSKSIGMGMLGGQGASNGTFIIRLKPWEQRKGKADDNKSVIAEIYRRLSDIKDARIMSFAQPIIAGYGVTNGFEVHIQDFSDKSVKDLENVTQEFISELTKRPEIARAQTSFNSNYPQYKVEVDAAMCKRNGISPVDVLRTLGAYVGGSYSSNINRFSKLYRVMLQAPAESRLSEESLRNIFVRNKSGQMSPISNYVTLTRIYGAENLTHFNLFQSIAINGAPADGYSSGQAIKAIEEVAKETLPSGYGYEFGAMTREEAETGNSSTWVFIICVIFIYLILAALYESVTIPFAVILSVPFGLSGSFLLAWMFGLENNIYMQTGVIMLIGLLAKTAILITEYAVEARRNGHDIKTSALLAAKHRLRPIIMTSATMILGLLPMIFASGVGSNGSKSLAIGVIGGMFLGTIALLFITPALFIQLANRK